MKVITLRNDFSQSGLTNVDFNPASSIYTQRPAGSEAITFRTPYKDRLFGQFRKEKNLGFFLEAFTKAHFSVDVHLVVQGLRPNRKMEKSLMNMQESTAVILL